jgi:P27 family predicted phage terminase small subunit
MSRGPPPLPTHLKLLRGNPGQRAINKFEPMPELLARPPEPPDDLGEYAKEEWRRIIGEAFNLRLVTAMDIQPLAAYCDAYERWRTAREAVRAMAQRDTVTHGFTRSRITATVSNCRWSQPAQGWTASLGSSSSACSLQRW